MTHTQILLCGALATIFAAGCVHNDDVISEDTIQTARSEYEEMKQRQIHNEYWQAQMERQEAMEAARERARERAEQRMMRRETGQ